MNIKEKLEDLHKQATSERSHYYVGSVVREAIDTITRMQYELDTRHESKPLTYVQLQSTYSKAYHDFLNAFPKGPDPARNNKAHEAGLSAIHAALPSETDKDQRIAELNKDLTLALFEGREQSKNLLMLQELIAELESKIARAIEFANGQYGYSLLTASCLQKMVEILEATNE